MNNKVISVTSRKIGDSSVLKVLQEKFEKSTDQLRRIVSAFQEEMERGLKGEPSSLDMIPTYVIPPTQAVREAKTQVLAVDFGGTNLRVMLVELTGNGTEPRVVHVVKRSLTVLELAHSTNALFGGIAATIAELLRTLPEDVKTALHTEGSIPLGFTYSYHVKQNSIRDAVVERLDKSLTIPDLIGKDPVEELQKELNEQGLGAIHVTALLNDTTGTLMTKAYLDPDTSLGGIIGTGTNFCIDVPVEMIRKPVGPFDGTRMYINMESGEFNKELGRNEYDVALDSTTENKGLHLQEKMVSGKYLGELAQHVLKELIDNGKLFNQVEDKQEVYGRLKEFSTVTMSLLEAAYYAHDYAPATDIIKSKLKLSTVTGEDVALIIRVCRLISTRAARVSAALVVAALDKIDPGIRSKHTVAIDGTVFEKYPHFEARMKETIQELVPEAAGHITLTHTRDGSGIGAALVGAVAAEER